MTPNPHPISGETESQKPKSQHPSDGTPIPEPSEDTPSEEPEEDAEQEEKPSKPKKKK